VRRRKTRLGPSRGACIDVGFGLKLGNGFERAVFQGDPVRGFLRRHSDISPLAILLFVEFPRHGRNLNVVKLAHCATANRQKKPKLSLRPP
jgi:hypothetical protein